MDDEFRQHSRSATKTEKDLKQQLTHHSMVQEALSFQLFIPRPGSQFFFLHIQPAPAPTTNHVKPLYDIDPMHG